MMEIRSIDEFHDFTTCWQAFHDPGSVAALSTGSAISISQALLSEASMAEQVAIKKKYSAEAICLWIKKLVQVAEEKAAPQDKAVVSIAAPQAHRQPFLHNHQDNPGHCRRGKLLQHTSLKGGNWDNSAGWIAGALFASIYIAPTPDCQDILRQVCEKIPSSSSNRIGSCRRLQSYAGRKPVPAGNQLVSLLISVGRSDHFQDIVLINHASIFQAAVQFLVVSLCLILPRRPGLLLRR